MSDVNNLDNKKCPFDLSKYKSNDVVAPIGSLPWAIIQVYMGKIVARSEWETPDEYIALTVKNPDSASHIDKHDKYGVSNWQPTSGDLMACDWVLLSKVKPVECMLSFDLEIGVGTSKDISGAWGYLADEESTSIGLSPFGILTSLKNKTDIKKLSLFIWDDDYGIILRVSSDKNQAGHQKMQALFKKDLTVTVSDVLYHLGGISEGQITGEDEYEFAGFYQDNDAKKLGALLKQNVDKTLHFCFNWK
ncbi:Thoeris anti-defense Tad2 family protein [Xenorhabdus anantnagensis]|uniref:DUF2829 domain-containing protein n=1 Tax=Xenorhabdus anantnagensis TaxID=3025875 RepID=A0ABT5LPM2_9GAMM|nr:MW1434 family type I TA system toxin [Xenorhabdus anantnagensis]MDC9596189.1 DUF2829 domain-containing protein [Xenorhabdus anantnagensis]